MRRIVRLSWILGIFTVSTTTRAEEPANVPVEAAQNSERTGADTTAMEPAAVHETPISTETTPSPTATPASSPVGVTPETTVPVALVQPVPLPTPPPPPPIAHESKPTEGWQTVFTGYFRAPMMLSLSKRSDAERTNDASSTQVVFAPNRLVDANYSSFGFTRLQEGDWGEVYLTEKKAHVAATIAYMGWWYTGSGYPQPSAGWSPAQAWVTLDSDFELGSLKPHVEFKAGIFWPKWGTFGKYDTYLFGRFHQAGEAVQVDLPINPNLNLRAVHGFGTNRNGSSTAGTGATLLHYAHVGLDYKKEVGVGLYYNDSFTRDPSLFSGNTPAGGGAYADANQADMTVVGADVNIERAVFGHLWLATSYLKVKNGWALSETVEVMHSPGGAGIAGNYMGFGQPGSTGSGSMVNFAFLYENSLSILQGKARGELLPDVTVNLFGMMANTNRDLTQIATISDKLHQLKWGTDVTVNTLNWLAFMLRYDQVHLDLDDSERTYAVITPRVVFSTHFLSNESIWLQYSRYFYGERVLLNQSTTQPYLTPDKNVLKLQANMSF
jgi:hypothetical protein